MNNDKIFSTIDDKDKLNNCIKFGPVNHDGLMFGLAMRYAKNIPTRLKNLIGGVMGEAATAGYYSNEFATGFWRFVSPRSVGDRSWCELRKLILEGADHLRIDVEVADWEPTNEIADLLDRDGKEIDLDERIRVLTEAFNAAAEFAETEAAAAATRTNDVGAAREAEASGATENKSEGYTRIPNEVLDDASLTLGARFTYGLLLRHAYGKDYCFPSQKRLAALMGISDKWLRTHLRELEAAGLVKTERKDRTRHNRYCLQRLVTP